MVDDHLWYAAGIIDGEGYIGITEVAPNGKKRLSPSIKAQVAVAMADPVIPAWMAETFGGTFHSYPPRKLGQRGCTYWRIQNRKAAEFCELIAPYLKLKRVQAELVVGYYSDPRFVFKQRRSIPAEEVEARREYVVMAKALNHPGGQ
jgi:hypothetical protein